MNQRSFVADLDVTTLMLTRERCLIRAPLTDPVRSAAGSARLGTLATLVDVGGSYPALAGCLPDWTATQDLSVHAVGWLTEGPIFADARLLRLGTKIIVVTADIYDGRGVEDFGELQAKVDAGAGQPGATDSSEGPVLTAKSLLTFARIPGSAASGVEEYDPAQWIGELRRTGVCGPSEGTLDDWIGLKVIDSAAGVVEVENTPYVGNSIGTVNGGVQTLMIEAAAEAMRPGLIATDMQTHFVSQLNAGPARTSGMVSRDARDHSVVTLQLYDAGANDQLGTLATVTLQRPPS